MLKLMMMAAALAASPLPTGTGDRAVPVIPGYGATHSLPGAAERPDPTLRQRVVFSLSSPAPAPDRVNPGLERVARFVNLLGEEGIRPLPGDIVAVVHGPATVLALTDGAYAARTGAARNPNLPLVRRLREAGVIVAVCSQALHAQSASGDQVAPEVRIDVSAMTTIANLQLRGYALIQH